MEHPVPTDHEIILDPKRYIVSKTDTKGIITYGNDYFVEISNYKESELIGKPHNLIRHPDMPKVIFKLMWDRIQIGGSIIAIVKNLAKDGSFYWVVTEFESKRDKLNNQITGYTAFRKAAPRDAIAEIEKVYIKLLEIEKESGIEGSRNYFIGMLEDKGLSYDEYIDKLVGNKGIFKVFFTAMKKVFG